MIPRTATDRPAGRDAGNTPSIGYAWWVVIALTAVYTLSFVDRTILGLLVPSIKRDLGVSDTLIGLLQGLAFSLFYTLMGLPIARMADTGNRRNVIVAGVSLALFAAENRDGTSGALPQIAALRRKRSAATAVVRQRGRPPLSDQEHPRNVRLLDAQRHQGPALLEAGPDQLSKSVDLSRAGTAAENHFSVSLFVETVRTAFSRLLGIDRPPNGTF